MATSDDAMTKLCEVMRSEYGAGMDFELALGELVGKARRLHDARMRDRQAAQLLPLGYKVAAERMGCAQSTVYARAERARNLSGRIAVA